MLSNNELELYLFKLTNIHSSNYDGYFHGIAKSGMLPTVPYPLSSTKSLFLRGFTASPFIIVSMT